MFHSSIGKNNYEIINTFIDFLNAFSNICLKTFA